MSKFREKKKEKNIDKEADGKTDNFLWPVTAKTSYDRK
jgi:hypothetical protein